MKPSLQWRKNWFNNMKIKKGDTVKILRGKDNGKTGKVIRVLAKEDQVAVEGLNVFKKHVRPKRQGEKGETVNVARPLPVANVAFFCSQCRQGVRLGFLVENGKKTRVCRKCGTAV